MKTTTTYKTPAGEITIEVRKPDGCDYWQSVDKVWQVSINGAPFIPDPAAGQVKIKGPYPARVLQEIVAWEQVGQPAESKPEVMKTAKLIWTDIS